MSLFCKLSYIYGIFFLVFIGLFWTYGSDQKNEYNISGHPLHKYKKNIIIFLCSFLILLFFFYTVVIRKPWLGKPLNNLNGWYTAHSICIIKNWLREGAFNLRFLLVHYLPGIEFSTLLDRCIYISYPPGAFIPVFLLAKVFSIVSIDNLVILHQVYNLFNHLIISLTMFLIMFQIIYYFRDIKAFTIFFSLTPSFVYLFTLPTLYWHQNAYFTDIAVIMPFAIFIYFELKYFLYRNFNELQKIIFAFIIFLGSLTDWFFLFVVFVAIILRIIFISNSIRFKQFFSDLLNLIIPTLLAMILYLYQVTSSSNLSTLYFIFKRRFIIAPQGEVTDAFGQVFWGGLHPKILPKETTQHLFVGALIDYGKILCFAFLFFVFLFLVYSVIAKARKMSNKKTLHTYVYLICLSILPCLLHTSTFQQHSIMHRFSVLKFAIPLSIIPFGTMPIFLYQRFRKHKHFNSIKLIIFVFCILALSRGVFYRTFKIYNRYFDEKEKGYKGGYNKMIGELVKRNAAYNDICFSFDFEIQFCQPDYFVSPSLLVYSEKRVYKINNFFEAKDKLSKLAKKEAVGKVFVHAKLWDNVKEEAVKTCSAIYTDSDYYVCEIAKFN